ncbi:MAG TPA: hypothetical protein VGI14_19790 [Casimicrobiaceae bacterium]
MKTMTLVTRRLYFGVDALRLRDAAERVLLRVQGLPPERACVNAEALEQDFGWNPGVVPSMIEQLVQSGMLRRPAPHAREFHVTEKFWRCARARVVDPLPRDKAHMILTHLAEVAARFNRTESRNKYEIETLAVFGGYMSTDDHLSDLSIGVTGRRRPPQTRARFGRATVPTEGTDQIRAMLEAPSSFVVVSFVHKLTELPRPFSVFFKGD